MLAADLTDANVIAVFYQNLRETECPAVDFVDDALDEGDTERIVLNRLAVRNFQQRRNAVAYREFMIRAVDAGLLFEDLFPLVGALREYGVHELVENGLDDALELT